MVDSIFELLERRMMKKDGVNYLDGIDEPIGKETADYINTQSMKLHDAEKVSETFSSILSEKYQKIKELEAEIENFKSVKEFNAIEHYNHLNEIWSYITDGLGDWEYPGQIMRRAKEVMEENRKLKAAEFNRTAGQLINDTELCRKCNTAYTNHLSGICIDCRKEG